MKHSRISGALAAAGLVTAAGAAFVCAACGSLPAPHAGTAGESVDITQPPPGSPDSDPSASDAGIEPRREEGLSAIFNTPKDEGLVTQDLQVGSGPSIQIGDMAKVHYVGRLADGTEFDTSRNRPGSFEFTLGRGMVIRGFERGMVGMRIGGLRRISIPWKLAYGEAGNPPRIPPRADLTFEIELLDIPVPAAKPPPPKTNPGAPPPPQ